MTVLWCLYDEYIWARASKFVGRSENSKQTIIAMQLENVYDLQGISVRPYNK